MAVLLALLAHAGEADVGEAGTTAFTVMLALVLAAVWGALGVICWIFWRAKRREDAKEKELQCRNVPSS